MLYHDDYSGKKKIIYPSLPKDRDREIVTELFCGIYLGGNETISTDILFNMGDIRIYCQINEAEFEGLLYTILSE